MCTVLKKILIKLIAMNRAASFRWFNCWVNVHVEMVTTI